MASSRPGTTVIGRRLVALIAAAWVVLILLISLTPVEGQVLSALRLCIVCGHEGALGGVVMNVLLYVPLGAYVGHRSGRLWPAVVTGVLLSCSVEFVQLAIPGRFSTLEDLLANSLGSAVGAGLALRPSSWLFPTESRGRSLGLAWAAVAALLVMSPGPLLSPSVSPGDLYFQWTPRIPSRNEYPGAGVSLVIDGVSLSLGRVQADRVVRNALVGEGRVAVRFEVAEPPDAYAPVFRIVAGPYGAGEDVFQVGVDGQDIVVRLPYVADDLHLARPDLTASRSLAGASAGDTVTLELSLDPRGTHGLKVDGVSYPLMLTAARGWSVFHFPRGLREWQLKLTDAMWVAALFLPLGWWLRSRPTLLLTASAPLAGLWLAPLLWPLGPTSLGHYLSGAAGLWGGHALRQLRKGRNRS